MGEKVVVKKVPLKDFIDTLVQVYNSGADYIDLVGNHDDDGQDTVGIIVIDEYMSNEDETIELIDDNEEPGKLSDEDIDDLI